MVDFRIQEILEKKYNSLQEKKNLERNEKDYRYSLYGKADLY
jgi:hypothetical protein